MSVSPMKCSNNDILNALKEIQPAPYSCLGQEKKGKPLDRGTWGAAVHGSHKRVGHNLGAKQQQMYTCFFHIFKFD